MTMTTEQYLLSKLAEECGEIVQMALKSQYFGLDAFREGQDLSNRQRLNSEIDDLLIILTFLQMSGTFTYEDLGEKSSLAKKTKVEKYWDLATLKGNVEKRVDYDE